AVGDTLSVVVKEIDELGRINLSLKGGSPRATSDTSESPQTGAEPPGEFDRPRRFGRGSSRRPPSRRPGPPQHQSGHFRS
ncbi:MAG: hypothetical protein Q8R32_02765, partial [bacterium]|nr:hypothetical protein [bacterium]